MKLVLELHTLCEEEVNNNDKIKVGDHIRETNTRRDKYNLGINTKGKVFDINPGKNTFVHFRTDKGIKMKQGSKTYYKNYS